MKVRPVLVVAVLLGAVTPAGRQALAGLLARVRGADAAPTTASSPPQALPAPGAGAGTGTDGVQPSAGLRTRAPLGPDATGTEVAIDLFEHRGQA